MTAEQRSPSASLDPQHSALLRTADKAFARWVCRWFGHALFVGHCTRCGYDKPFVVGRVRR